MANSQPHQTEAAMSNSQDPLSLQRTDFKRKEQMVVQIIFI